MQRQPQELILPASLSSHAHQRSIRQIRFFVKAQRCANMLSTVPCLPPSRCSHAAIETSYRKIHGSPMTAFTNPIHESCIGISFETAVPLPEFPYGTPSWTLILFLIRFGTTPAKTSLPFNSVTLHPIESMSRHCSATSSLSSAAKAPSLSTLFDQFHSMKDGVCRDFPNLIKTSISPRWHSVRKFWNVLPFRISRCHDS